MLNLGQAAVMNPTLLKAIAALVPVAMLLLGSLVLLGKTRSAAPLLQLVGASGLMIVVLSHVCEALVLMAWMKWGQERSVAHYVDLGGALIGITVFQLDTCFTRSSRAGCIVTLTPNRPRIPEGPGKSHDQP